MVLKWSLKSMLLVTQQCESNRYAAEWSSYIVLTEVPSDGLARSENPPRKRARVSRDRSFPCLMSGCKASFDNDKNWRDHQNRIHFPQSVFICGRMENGFLCHKLITRVENARSHIERKHEVDSGSNRSLDAEIARRTVNVRNLYHNMCGFCEQSLPSRRESMCHIIEHMRKMVDGGDVVHGWHHRCDSDHSLKEGVHYDLPEHQDELYQDPSRKRDGDCGGSGANGSPHGNLEQSSGSFSRGGTVESQQSSGPFPGSFSTLHDTHTSSHENSQSSNQNLLAQRTALQETRSKFSKGPRYFKLPNSFKTTKLLGVGSSGRVFEVVHEDTGTLFAVKRIFWSKTQPGAEPARLRILQEIEIMRSLQHRHIVKYCGSFSTEDGYAIIMQPSAAITLADLFKSPESAAQRLRWNQERLTEMLLASMGCIANAIAYLHHTSVCHGDIKPQNVLVFEASRDTDSGCNFMVADFGISKLDGKSSGSAPDACAGAKTIPRTPRYSAPELHRTLEPFGTGTVGHARDVWSLGCVFVELLTFAFLGKPGIQRFENFRTADRGDSFFYQTLESTQEWLRQFKHFSSGQTRMISSQSIVDVIRPMLDQDPMHRPTAYQVWSKLPKRICCRESPTAEENIGKGYNTLPPVEADISQATEERNLARKSSVRVLKAPLQLEAETNLPSCDLISEAVSVP